MAQAFGVRAATVRSWESGRSQPTGKRREAYGRFLQGLSQRADAQPSAAAQPRTAVLPASRRPESVTRPAAVLRVPDVPRGPQPVTADRTSSNVATAAAVLTGWALVLILLSVYLPQWAA